MALMARRILLTLLFVFVGSTAAWAQTQTGQIFGEVTDPDGEPLPGVTVTLNSDALGTEQTRVTDVEGRYLFVALPPGEYTVTFSLEGFQTLIREEIQVSIARTVSVDALLELSSVQETVTITGQAPVVDMQDTTVEITFSEEALQDVPSARDVWSVLEHQAPAVITDRADVGGSEQGLQAIFSARGSSWQQNTYKLNGVTVTDPSAIGASGFYYDYDSFEEVQISTGSHSAEVAYPGVELNLVTKSGTNEFHGAAQYYRSGFAQADNIDQELQDLGISRGSEIDYISDGSAQLGGPIAEDRAWFFGSYRDWRVFRFVPGFPEVESTEMPVFLIKPSFQLDDDNRIDLFYTRQTYFKPNRNASATVSPQSTWIEDDVFSVYQVQWQSLLSDNAFLDLRGSFLDVDFPLLFQPDAEGQAVIDIGTGRWTGPAPNQFFFRRKRWSADASLSWFTTGASGSHDIKLGVQYTNAPVTTRTDIVDDVLLLPFNGSPFLVQQFSTPNITRQTLNMFSLYVSDAWTIGSNFTVKAGLRYDTTSGDLPEQRRLGGLWFEPQAFPEIDNVISGWGGLAPRLSLIYQLPNERTALKASGSLYYHQLGTGQVNFPNPNGTITRTFFHNDINDDGQFQAGEEGTFLGESGGNVNRVDPDLDSGRTWEFTAGIEHEFAEGWMAGATFIYRKENDLPDQLNTAIDFDRDFVPVQGLDPGPDGVVGTGDDQTIQVFNQVSNIGASQFLLTNIDAKESEYKGVELIVRRRFANNWQVQAALTLGEAEGVVPVGGAVADQSGTSGLFTTPNGTINSQGNLSWDRPYVFKLSGSYLLPGDILVAGVLRSQSGLPISRIATITQTVDGTPLGQGEVEVYTFPRGDERLDAVTTADIRAGKEFPLDFGTLGVYADVFNITNANTITTISQQGGSFGDPTGILGPRLLRLGFRFTF